ncbi:30S ribosomal protein S12 methylthiotransferase RimO [Sphaerochaeta sp. PS]|uniref:30S ribosomal protein S12 methylthiotransferase RimO n=1 Tax=Sphaerochaeta sp. PS TaxID=3076336 RepID=UPI0028A30153|nr:30S ribosomal protein S12 methylthiotransferase RimO [Sphaerochaeta sp. PS]MDT4761303.1 30S ribosomal protein S12 methylthiotransferase RimO [Sphaerochaeta sp. PS]
MKKLYLENLGCSKNQVDAETMLNLLAEDDYIRTDDPTEADVMLVNTCGFIESAREQSIESFFSLHETNPQAKILLTGCMAQRYAQDLSEELLEASAIFGNRDLSKIREVVDRVVNGERVVETYAYPPVKEEVYERNELLSFPGSAYLKISEGCNHRCSYCAIPLIRGSLRSRPMEMILEDARRLLDRGIRELNLIAQDLAAFGTDTGDGSSQFMELLKRLVALEGNFVLRLLYIHPDAFPPELPQFIVENPKVLPYFDIPFQHAATSVLRSMGRTGTKESYLALIESIRSTVPGAVIRSTILLGYPGEDAQAFAELQDFLKKAQLDWMGSFLYSREEGTKAFGLRGEKDHDKAHTVAAKYQKKLEALQQPITVSRLEQFVGKEYDVLIEEKIQEEDLAIGRIYSQAPEVDGLTVVMGRDLVPGSVVRCGIRAVKGLDLEAVVLERVDG